MFTFLHPMLVDREESPRLIDVLDRCLDRGIVIDAWVRVSVVGLELLTVESRVVVASIETFLGHAQPLTETQSICARLGSGSRPCDRAAPDREH